MSAILPQRALPDHTQLPESDGAIVHNFQEHPQSILLTDAIRPVLDRLHPDRQYCIGQDSGIYWAFTEPPLRGCLAPDWFCVRDVPPTLNGESRRSFVMWQEMQVPLIVLEYVSGDGSEERDRTPREGKFWIYEQRIRAGYYGIYEVNPGRIEMYRMTGGHFELMAPNKRGHFPVVEMGVELGLWQGEYLGANLPWMRWFDDNGFLLLTGHERAERESEVAQREREAAQRERENAERQKRRADRLAQRLRELGEDPDQVKDVDE